MKTFLIAARPKTLLAGIIPPLVSYTYFYQLYNRHELVYLFLCLVGALAIQLATNFYNDVIDFQKGADTPNRVGPTRVSAQGLVSLEKVQLWAHLSLSVAFICGIPLILRGGIIYLILGSLSIYLTYGYTGGKVSLAYRGLGELFVFLFFGLFSVMGSFYLYALELPFEVLILASQMGLLTTTLIAVNNLRDRNTDAQVQKKTLATRMSPRNYRIFTLVTIFLPYLLVGFFPVSSTKFITLLALPVACKLSHTILKKEGAQLNEGLKFAGIHLLLFAFFLGVNFLL